LKMNEAASFTGEFAHWSAERRDERIALFFSLIEKYAAVAITSAVPLEIYQNIFSGKRWKHFRHPYYILFFGIVHSISHYFANKGHLEAIDFIFDAQPEQAKLIMPSWEVLRTNGDEKLRHLVTNPPIFRDDRTTLPLQAADLHMWWARRILSDAWMFKPEIIPPFPGKRMSLKVPLLRF